MTTIVPQRKIKFNSKDKIEPQHVHRKREVCGTLMIWDNGF